MERSRRRRLADTYMINVERVAAAVFLDRGDGGGDGLLFCMFLCPRGLEMPFKLLERYLSAPWRWLLRPLKGTFYFIVCNLLIFNSLRVGG